MNANPNETPARQNPLLTQEASAWKAQMEATPYRSYLYSYPHKTAYRPFPAPLPLDGLWHSEPAETLFLYMHIPFCGARCGFCNLFTLPDKRADVHERYVDALERQAREWAGLAGGRPFARFAIGGGTPTLLEAGQLRRLFRIAEDIMGLDPHQASISVETSPETVSEEKLAVLKEAGVDRISMGVQSFIPEEAAAVYRPQNPRIALQALELLGKTRFPVLNLDLIYGLPGQTVDSWMVSVRRALDFAPEEIFLYPLYTRDHTIVKPEHMARSGDDIRMACYKEARGALKAAGYTQYSMRRFARNHAPSASGAADSGSAADASPAKRPLDYSCQEEGMMGLGCGARSYTREVHYASRYGVSRKATESIIADYVAAESYGSADYGFVLDGGEQRRRFILKALLHREGLALHDYRERFGGASPLLDFPQLQLPLAAGFAAIEDDTLMLTEEGMAYSDAIGDWFISPEVYAEMERFVLP